MKPWNCLIGSIDSLFLDASVVINLIATKCPEIILDILPNRILVSEHAAIEVARGDSRRPRPLNTVSALAEGGKFEIVAPGSAALPCFETLVAGVAKQTLGDGEAATIACALGSGAIALIDDRKALRICGGRFSGLKTATTMDLLSHDQVWKVLGSDSVRSAIPRALYHGRMHVPVRYLNWVVELTGQRKAMLCHSLPKSVRRPTRVPPR